MTTATSSASTTPGDSPTGPRSGPTNVVPLRRVPNWIDSFVRLTEHTNSPERFRLWAALAALSAVLQRSVWFRFNGTKVFCNLYIALVGGPGVGKTIIINAIYALVSIVSGVNLTPKRVTPEKLLQLLSKATKSLAGGLETQSPYSAFIPELGLFLRHEDVNMVNILLELYDCQNFRYETISREPTIIENVYFTLLGGTTPKAFGSSIVAPFGEIGIISRFNIVYSNESKPPNIFGAKAAPDTGPLVEDLRAIAALHGEATFSTESQAYIEAWVQAGMPPAPTDGRFAEYLPRRAFHFMKLCVLASVAHSSSLRVELSDVQTAQHWLLDAEAELPEVAAHFGNSAQIGIIRALKGWLQLEYAKRGTGLSEALLRRKLLEDLSPQYVNATIVELVQSGMVRVKEISGARFYFPPGVD